MWEKFKEIHFKISRYFSYTFAILSVAGSILIAIWEINPLYTFERKKNKRIDDYPLSFR
ncbi:hypothetical protein Calla_0278 [Caldicellulosiruptor acetigenus 6A]|uniref:Uncharacterized protein n=1 Tax=Caldicellulosiruptor acetigenus 6A TaxID=632516 RepID=G2PX00_9FIRM|nr:hypothetical protein Calla_0278 [Caldicellulosiruptor acetigenus 6A]